MAEKKIRSYGSSSRKISGNNAEKATAQEVDDFHTNSDLDLRLEAQHHTLGSGPNQAAPGDHIHDGGDSALILEGLTITGSRADDAWRVSVNALLVRLGATDSSSA
jgi:hypothetical protein